MGIHSKGFESGTTSMLSMRPALRWLGLSSPILGARRKNGVSPIATVRRPRQNHITYPRINNVTFLETARADCDKAILARVGCDPTLWDALVGPQGANPADLVTINGLSRSRQERTWLPWSVVFRNKLKLCIDPPFLAAKVLERLPVPFANAISIFNPCFSRWRLISGILWLGGSLVVLR
jgi:hypothetical protein